MWKFIYYPHLSYDKVEKKLSDYEKSGLRLVSAKWRYFFELKEATPKKSKYVFTYELPRENKMTMTEYEYDLKREYGANEIPSKHMSVTIYRITEEAKDVGEIKSKIKNYYAHCFRTYILLCLSYLIMYSGVMALTATLTEGLHFNFEIFLLSVVAILSMLYVIRCLIGIYITKKSSKNKTQISD